jgi:hypothetical protein
MTMKNEDTRPADTADAAGTPAYEAPAIEETITSEEMEREVHYAGDGTTVFG